MGLPDNKHANERRERIIKDAQKSRKAYGETHDNRGEADCLLPRGPVHVT